MLILQKPHSQDVVSRDDVDESNYASRPVAGKKLQGGANKKNIKVYSFGASTTQPSREFSIINGYKG